MVGQVGQRLPAADTPAGTGLALVLALCRGTGRGAERGVREEQTEVKVNGPEED
jgi:hypothetical protein